MAAPRKLESERHEFNRFRELNVHTLLGRCSSASLPIL